MIDNRQHGKNSYNTASNKTTKYIDQAEIINKNHLAKSKHDSSHNDMLSEVSTQFSLNKEQDGAFHIVAQHAVSTIPEQLRMYIGGMGGTGKSQVIKALTEYFECRNEGNRLICVAPTGTAASIVKGSTYHFMFGINEFNGGELTKWSMAEVKS